mgnify:CR=1 FL=1|tara:strand:+ start:1551 stop:2105 length:555 start_codon:yes stop_codon:yes gene_type:complete
MLLARLVNDGSTWFEAVADPNVNGFNLKPEALSSFIPSPKDNGWLSLYVIDEIDDEELIAAALAYNRGTIEASHFVAADSSLLEAKGLKIQKTIGETFHSGVNNKHYELHIPDAETLLKAVEIFVAGEYRPVENSRVRERLGQSAVNDNIDFSLVLANKINGNVATRTLEMVKEKYLKLNPGDA